MHKLEYYNQAFFELSIGLERLGKLIFIADHVIRYNGRLPTNYNLRTIGHDVLTLLDECEIIGDQLSKNRLFYERPNDVIHNGIVEVLSMFAKTLRYYNLNLLTGAQSNQADPIGLWWKKVGEPICDKHYTESQRKQDEEDGQVLDDGFSKNSIFLHMSEEGVPLTSVSSLYVRGRAIRVVQLYGRLYTLQIVRWLTSLIMELEHRGAYESRIQALLGLPESFVIFFNEDTYIRERKTWTIYT